MKRTWILVLMLAVVGCGRGIDKSKGAPGPGPSDTSSNNTTSNNGPPDSSTNNTSTNNRSTNNTSPNNTSPNNRSTNNTSTNNRSTNNDSTNNTSTNNASTNNTSTNNRTTGEMCGDGVIGGSETCDGNCPTACNDGDSCTTDRLHGSASTCDAECEYAPVTSCVSGDGCCPAGCSFDVDSDCNCVPKTCAQLGAECGTIDDGCGATVSCTDTCSAGEVCGPQNECTPEESYVGEPCTDYPDCGSSPDAACILPPAWPNGYCSLLCTSGGPCPSESHCTNLDGTDSVCMLDCTTNSECAAGYECRDWDLDGTRECAPPDPPAGSGAAGDACQSDTDCQSPYTCETELQGTNGGVTTAPGGVCTSQCLPLFGECNATDATCSIDGYCLKSCTFDTECRSGYFCMVGLTDDSGYCYPS